MGSEMCIRDSNLRTNFHWLKAKLSAVGVRALNASFPRYVDDQSKDIRDVGRAVRISSSVLLERPKSFAHQMFGRLGHNPHGRIAKIVEDAKVSVDFTPTIMTPHLLPLGAEIARFSEHHGLVNSAVFSHDGTRILTASNDETARLWDAQSGDLIKALECHTERIRSAVFSHDGTRVLTTSYDETARIWDAQSGDVTDFIEFDAGTNFIAENNMNVCIGLENGQIVLLKIS